ncbi:MAG: hypothetical protein K1X33_07600 [Methanobacteriaceae archaeon]|nr:hypothetical protein [Methanobacteriaceae archaeon]
MKKYVKIILAILIIIVMSGVFLSVVTSQGNTHTNTNSGSVSNNEPSSVTIYPSTTSGEGIRTVSDTSNNYIVSITNSGDGQTYYFTNRSMVYKMYETTHGNYSQPFNCTFHNGTVNGIKNAHIITSID